MSHALKFSQDFQRMKVEKPGITNKEVITRTMEENLSLIDKPKSIGNVVYFIDDSWAVWTGSEWRVCEPSEEELKNKEDDEKVIHVKSAVSELKRHFTDKGKRTHSTIVNDGSGRIG